jgi:hypothetical protein
VLNRLQPSSFAAVQNDEGLARSLLDHYGFNRLTEVRRQYLAKIFRFSRQRREFPGTAEKRL